MAPETMLLGVCAVLMVVGVTNAAEGQVASVVVGLARCADSTRKNMKSEAGFKGLQVAIKCKNSNGEYETKAVSEIQSSGAFSVPLAADLHGADCHAQLHSAANNAPCPGQEPSRIAPMSGDAPSCWAAVRLLQCDGSLLDAGSGGIPSALLDGLLARDTGGAAARWS
uniref:Pollen Ole e 1 allergen and extensin family protein n=1 Tax=Zea mays TaxID=4577 RepID=C0PAE2_MAIZE|nr:unknown [Zea mays]